MKLFVFTLLLPSLATANPLGVDEAKLKTFAAKARGLVQEYTGKETQRFLYQHLPGLFPLQTACSSTSAEGKKQTYLPGDLVQVQAALSLRCSGGLSVQMQPGSSLVVGQGENGPELQLSEGAVWIRFGKGPVSVKSEGFAWQSQGETTYNDLMIHKNAKGIRVLCTRGLLLARMQTAPSGAPNESYLGIQGCRVALERESGPGRLHLFHDTVVQPANIHVPSSHWPLLDAGLVFPELAQIQYGDQTRIDLSFAGGPSEKSPGKLSWASPFRGAATCTLYTQSQEGQEPVKAYEFSAPDGNGSMALHPDYRKYWISLICNKDGVPYISNLLHPATK